MGTNSNREQADQHRLRQLSREPEPKLAKSRRLARVLPRREQPDEAFAVRPRRRPVLASRCLRFAHAPQLAIVGVGQDLLQMPAPAAAPGLLPDRRYSELDARSSPLP